MSNAPPNACLRRLTQAVCVGLALVVLSVPTLGQDHTYRGPFDEVPVDRYWPHDARPLPTESRDATPDAPARTSNVPIDLSDWRFWWNHNCDEFTWTRSAFERHLLRYRHRLKTQIVHIRGVKDPDRASNSPFNEHFGHVYFRDIEPVFLDPSTPPALRAALALMSGRLAHDKTDADLRALAVGVEPTRDEHPPGGPSVRHTSEQIRDAALLALGMHGSSATRTKDRKANLTLIIKQLSGDTQRAADTSALAAAAFAIQSPTENERTRLQRALIREIASTDTPAVQRATYFWALGMVGDAAILRRLLATLRVRKPKTGSPPSAEPQRAAEAEALVRLTSRPLSAQERGHALDAAGRIVARSSDARKDSPKASVEAALRADVARVALEHLSQDSKRQEDLPVQMCALTALSRTAPTLRPEERARCIDRLVWIIDTRKHAYDDVVGLAVMALGRIGSHASLPIMERREIAEVLARMFDSKKHRKYRAHAVRPHAALALGLLGRRMHESGAEFELQSLVDLLRARFESASRPSTRGALALALGLCRDESSRTKLIAVIRDEEAPEELRGHCLQALGLFRPISPQHSDDSTTGKSSRDVILSSLTSGGSVAFRVHALRAAGQIGDPRFAPPTLNVLLDRSAPLAVRCAAVRALGQIAEINTMEALSGVIQNGNGKHDVLTRGLAAAVFSATLRTEIGPDWERLVRDVNYRASLPVTRLIPRQF